MTPITFAIPPARIETIIKQILIALCLGNAFALVLLHGAGIEDGWGVVTLLHLDREQNLPTLFSVLLLLGASLLAGLSAHRSIPGGWLHRGWWIVSTALALMAIDEFASIHERVDAAMRFYLGTENLPYAAWPIPYLIIVILAGITLWRWFFSLQFKQALGLVIAGTIYLSGAVGIELIAGEYIAQIDPDHLGHPDLTRDLFATVEETAELCGLYLLIRTLAKGISEGPEAVSMREKNGTAFPVRTGED
ncbi:MAG: hypothetical protein GYB36_07855 [Alphaproteobacteria bacterium]|nr:hypothetical protein [Alphaproteobacteria bacterium]